MSFFRKLFDKNPVSGLQLGADKHAHHYKEPRADSDSDDDDEAEALSCPQLQYAPRRGGLDGGLASEDRGLGLHEPMRRSR